MQLYDESELPWKVLGTKAQQSFPVGKLIDCQLSEMQVFHMEGHRRSACPPRPRFTHLHLAGPPDLYLRNETVLLTIALSSVLWVILLNCQIWESCGNPQIYQKAVRNLSRPEGSPELAIGLWSAVVLLETLHLNLWSLTLTLGI